jgi:sec-independent protein translocase protein TatA
MGNIGWTGIIIVAALVVLLFGRGKISSIMGDVAKGIKSFKKGMSDDSSTTDQSKNIPSEDTSKNISSEDTSSEDSNSEKK